MLLSCLLWPSWLLCAWIDAGALADAQQVAEPLCASPRPCPRRSERVGNICTQVWPRPGLFPPLAATAGGLQSGRWPDRHRVCVASLHVSALEAWRTGPVPTQDRHTQLTRLPTHGCGLGLGFGVFGFGYPDIWGGPPRPQISGVGDHITCIFPIPQNSSKIGVNWEACLPSRHIFQGLPARTHPRGGADPSGPVARPSLRCEPSRLRPRCRA